MVSIIQNGGELISRSSDLILSLMRVGYRTSSALSREKKLARESRLLEESCTQPQKEDLKYFRSEILFCACVKNQNEDSTSTGYIPCDIGMQHLAGMVHTVGES